MSELTSVLLVAPEQPATDEGNTEMAKKVQPEPEWMKRGRELSEQAAKDKVAATTLAVQKVLDESKNR